MEAIYAVVAFVLVAGVTAGIALLAQLWDPLVERLRGPGGPRSPGPSAVSILRWEEVEPRELPQWRRTMEKFGRALLGRAPETRQARQSAVRRRLVWAGFQDPRSVQAFLGAKVFTAFGLAYSYTLYGLAVKRVLPQLLLVSVVLAIIGFFLPDLWLYWKIKKRKLLILHAVPDVLDLLVVCVEAGLALDAAFARVTNPELGKGTPLHEELRRVHLEFRAGRPRAEALHGLGERTGVEEVRRIVAAFVQTEKLGTSLADTLRVHAEAARVKRRHRAEKAAYMAPLKMMFPIVFFLFPAIFVVTLAPALLKIAELLGVLRIK